MSRYDGWFDRLMLRLIYLVGSPRPPMSDAERARQRGIQEGVTAILLLVLLALLGAALVYDACHR